MNRHLSKAAQRQKAEERRQAVMEYIQQYTAQHTLPPTLKEIMAAVGMNSSSVIRNDLQLLANDGHIVLREDFTSRQAHLPHHQAFLALGAYLIGQGVDLRRLLEKGELV